MRAHEMQCDEMILLLQAEVDGELDAAQAATVVHHREHCAQCASIYQNLLQLREQLRTELRHQIPSAEFRTALRARLSAAATNAVTTNTAPTNTVMMSTETISAVSAGIPPHEQRKQFRGRRSWSMFGTGAALAASLVFILIKPNEGTLADAAVTEHIRSLQAEHLLDVVSTDQHTVKPWFNGKLDFAPPVKDFAESGFPLAGGRLDYLDGRTVAALIYYHGKHPINVFIWPNSTNHISSAPDCLQRAGYHVCNWSSADMNYWAVSDLNEAELQKFSNYFLN